MATAKRCPRPKPRMEHGNQTNRTRKNGANEMNDKPVDPVVAAFVRFLTEAKWGSPTDVPDVDEERVRLEPTLANDGPEDRQRFRIIYERTPPKPRRRRKPDVVNNENATRLLDSLESPQSPLPCSSMNRPC